MWPNEALADTFSCPPILIYYFRSLIWRSLKSDGLGGSGEANGAEAIIFKVRCK